MARIAGINIPPNKIVSIALTYIHGIGLHSSKQICEKLNIPKDVRVNNLTEDLKFLVIQSFYYENRFLFKKQIRDENIRSFIKILNSNIQNGKERSIFSGKIGVLNKKIYINLT